MSPKSDSTPRRTHWLTITYKSDSDRLKSDHEYQKGLDAKMDSLTDCQL